LKPRPLHPSPNGFARLLRDLGLNRPLGFLLHDDGARGYWFTLRDISKAKLHQIARSQLAVERQLK
jgi:hypothetical protein